MLVERGRQVARHPPPLVQVGDDDELLAHGGPGGPHGLEADTRLRSANSYFYRPKAGRFCRQGGLGTVLRATGLAKRGVGGQAPGGAAEQHADRLPGDLADDVPQRGLQRPVAAGVEADRLDGPHVVGDGQRVPAGEQRLEGLEAVHRVARAVPGDALVGLHRDQGGVEVTAREGVPGRVERRIQWQPHPVEPDRINLHDTGSRSPREISSTSGSRSAGSVPSAWVNGTSSRIIR
jgi:hypothetical protein